MSFELKQILTQIVAFLIMLWILKRYLWTPLMSLMDERARSIKASFQQAEEKNQQADLLLEQYEKKISEIKDEGQIIIQAAVKESQNISQQIQQDAQRKAHEILNRAQEQAKLDLAKARVELKKEIVEISFYALEKLINAKLTKEDKERFNLEVLDKV